jgi:hypothetical protein
LAHEHDIEKIELRQCEHDSVLKRFNWNNTNCIMDSRVIDAIVWPLLMMSCDA